MIHASLQEALESLLHRFFRLPTCEGEHGELIRISFMWRGKPKQCGFHFTPGAMQVLFRDSRPFRAAIDWIVRVDHDHSLSLSCIDERGNIPNESDLALAGLKIRGDA